MSTDGESEVTRITSRPLRDRKTYWYTVSEVSKEATCPSCGRSMDKFKNITAHVKRCFSIKKIGPIYRLHGYLECKCGLLIADNTKAQKLHVCTGEIPAFEPDLSYVRKKRPPTPEAEGTLEEQSPAKRRRELPKPWIRNFVSPFKLDIENIEGNFKPEPRVRNFDRPAIRLEPQNVSVYSINSNNGTIFLTGQSPKSGKQSLILISKPALNIPRLKGGKCS